MATWFGKAIRFVSDTAVGLTDSTLSLVGAGGVIPNSAYSSSKSAGAWNQVADLKNVASNAILNAVAPGSGSVLGAAQKLNPSQRSGSGSSSTTGSPVNIPANASIPASQTAESSDTTTYIILGSILLVLIVSIILFRRK